MCGKLTHIKVTVHGEAGRHIKHVSMSMDEWRSNKSRHDNLTRAEIFNLTGMVNPPDRENTEDEELI